MDGHGRWMDNVFIERLWRSLKHEESISTDSFYNGRRFHQPHGYRMPMAA